MHVDQYFQYFDYELFVKQTIIQKYLDKMEKFTVFKPNITFFFSDKNWLIYPIFEAVKT